MRGALGYIATGSNLWLLPNNPALLLTCILLIHSDKAEPGDIVRQTPICLEAKVKAKAFPTGARKAKALMATSTHQFFMVAQRDLEASFPKLGILVSRTSTMASNMSVVVLMEGITKSVFFVRISRRAAQVNVIWEPRFLRSATFALSRTPGLFN